jgi:hypothetical protein
MLLAGLLYHSNSQAQHPVFSGDARSQGMANARVMISNSWSGLNNPAGLAGIGAISFGLYVENRYQVSELSLGAFSLGIPTKTGTYGISYAAFGYSLFNQEHASLSYGKALGKKIRAGIGIHYLMICQPYENGNLYAFVPSLGIQLLPVNGLTVGFHVFNPAGQPYNPAGYIKIPAVYSAGVGYNLGNEVLLCAEAEKSSLEKTKYYGGVEFTLVKIFLVRFGLSSGEFQKLSFGIGYHGRQVSIDMAATRHPILDFQTSLSLSYAIK